MGLNQISRADLPRWERLVTSSRPATERWEVSRALRRIAAVVAVAGHPLIMFVLPIDSGLSAVAEITILVMLVATWLGGFVFVYEFRRRLANAADIDLDERERQQRDRAHLLSMRLFAIGAMLVGVVASIAIRSTSAGVVAFDPSTVMNIAVSVTILALVLPAAIVAWQEPDDEADEPAAGAEVSARSARAS